MGYCPWSCKRVKHTEWLDNNNTWQVYYISVDWVNMLYILNEIGIFEKFKWFFIYGEKIIWTYGNWIKKMILLKIRKIYSNSGVIWQWGVRHCYLNKWCALCQHKHSGCNAYYRIPLSKGNKHEPEMQAIYVIISFLVFSFKIISKWKLNNINPICPKHYNYNMQWV